MIIGRIIWRLFLVTISLLIAALVGLLVIVYGIYNLASKPPIFEDAQALITYVQGGLIFTVLTFSSFSIMAALGAIVLGEMFKIKHWIYYMAVGALSFFVAKTGVLLGDDRISSAILTDTQVRLFLASGFAGGLIYWLMAGRSAGNWMSASANKKKQDREEKTPDENVEETPSAAGTVTTTEANDSIVITDQRAPRA